jgi:3-hydroxyacyl-CoA dehydrogenase
VAWQTCDLVIESATEDETVKRKIFAALPVLKEAILATNTSSISITRLAPATDRPEKFIGIHFMNPVPVMELVELVRGIATATRPSGLARIRRRSASTITVAEDFPAFIVNRILLPMINEAIYTLYEGVGSVEAIDTAMKLGANHPMGPLELADFIGLDTCLSIMQVLYDGLADQVPALPAAGEICRGRLAGPQDPARLLRLPRRDPGPDTLTDLNDIRAHTMSEGDVYLRSFPVDIVNVEGDPVTRVTKTLHIRRKPDTRSRIGG